LWMWCQQGKQSSSMPTSRHRQNSGSVSIKFGFTTILQKSCFSITVQGSTLVQSLGKSIKKNFAGPWHHIFPRVTYLEPCRMQSVVWSSRQMISSVVQWDLDYKSRTRQCTDMAYTHLFVIYERPQ
jgi:hypothetical protein